MSRFFRKRDSVCRRSCGDETCVYKACACHNLSARCCRLRCWRHTRLYNSQVPCHSLMWSLYPVSFRSTWVGAERDNSTLSVSSSISVYIVRLFSVGKMEVRDLRRSSVSCERSKNLLVRFTSRFQIRPVQTLTVFGMYLTRQIEEMILIPHVFQCHYILWVQRNMANLPPLMKESLRKQNDTDIPVLSAFRNLVTYVLWIDVF